MSGRRLLGDKEKAAHRLSVDASKLNMGNTYDSPPEYYCDIEFTCQDCGSVERFERGGTVVRLQRRGDIEHAQDALDQGNHEAVIVDDQHLQVAKRTRHFHTLVINPSRRSAVLIIAPKLAHQ